MNDREVIDWMNKLGSGNEKIVENIGKQMMVEMKKKSPERTGKYKSSIQGKLVKSSTRGPAFVISNKSSNHFNIITYQIEKGTKPRFREYKNKKKGIKFKSPAPTGRVAPQPFLDGLLNKYSEKLKKSVLSEMDKSK